MSGLSERDLFRGYGLDYTEARADLEAQRRREELARRSPELVRVTQLLPPRQPARPAK